MAYTGAFVFGDSLVDAGNALKLAEWYDGLPLSDLPEGAPTAALGYVEGRFSNGYTFADLIANKAIGLVTKPVFPYGFEDPWIGLPIAPFASDPSGKNLNFAYGGAQIRQGNEVVPDLDGQTDTFRNAVDGKADPGALYIVTIGGNDVRSLAPSGSAPVAKADAYAALGRAADKMITELTQLVQIGVHHILITGTPDVGLIPQYDRDRNLALDSTEQLRAAAATDYSIHLDTLIRTKVVPALQSLGAAVTYAPIMDHADGSGQLVTGALNANLPTIAALNGLTTEELAGNLLKYQSLVFFDQVHPTAQVHALVGAYTHARLTGTAWIETLPVSRVDADYRTSASISVAGEVDKLVVALVAGTTYRFEMLGVSSLATAGSLGDPSLRLLGASGTLAASDEDSGAGFDASLTFTAATSGNHSLELSATGSLTGAYVFQATVVSGAAMTSGNTYTVSSAQTLVLEGAGGVGEDVVKTSVSYLLGAASEIEVLRTTNDKGKTAINLTGNDFAQALVGNSASNALDGGAGDDTLTGLAGSDTLTGGAGRDTFRDTASGLNGDRIVDFGAGDRIVISDAKIASFAFSLSGTTLTYSGGKLTFGSAPAGQLVASAAAGGGVQLTLAVAAQRDVRSDFNGDGRSDVLWRSDSGTVANWLGQSNGGFAVNDSNAFAQVPTNWRIVGTGDFNGDGRDDILWRSDSGQLSNWLANASGGFVPNDANAFAIVATAWKIVGTGDFNGDGRDDILWRSDSGQLSNWLATPTGGFVPNDSNALTTVPTASQVVGTGDFNGDGRDDILWRGDTGRLTNWLAQSHGGFVSNDVNALTSIPAGWVVDGIGDFNGDGRDDLLLRSSAGEIATWLATSSGGFLNSGAGGQVGSGWQVAGAGDYNGDGRDDLIWRSESGAFTNWLGQPGGGFVSNDANAFTQVGTEWRVQPEQDLWL